MKWEIGDFGLTLDLELDDSEIGFTVPQRTNLRQFPNKSLPKWGVYSNGEGKKNEKEERKRGKIGEIK